MEAYAAYVGNEHRSLSQTSPSHDVLANRPSAMERVRLQQIGGAARSADEVFMHFPPDFAHSAVGIHQHLAAQKGWLAEVGTQQKMDPAGCGCPVHHQRMTGTQLHHLRQESSNLPDMPEMT